MRFASRLAVTVAAATVLTLPATTALAATTPTTDGYGHHVASCAQIMGGFTGDHNPGIHQGASGWDGQPCQ